MRLVYVDSSFLLAILFAEPRGEAYARLWDEAGARLSSIMLAVECSVVLHRVKASDPVWEWFQRLLGEVNLHLVDERIAERIRADAEYGNLRSLDAIHLATACEARDATGERLGVACLDRRLRDSAAAHGLALLPEKLNVEEQV